MKVKSLEPVWVEFIPDQIDEGKIYISEKYGTAIHKCCCGCGEEVVTPLSPADWRIIKTGQGITLHPSIGNWSYPCRSHYFIRNNRVVWAAQMTPAQIKRNQQADTLLKERYIAELNRQRIDSAEQSRSPASEGASFVGLISAVWRYIKSFF
jgi:hypothetical protein